MPFPYDGIAEIRAREHRLSRIVIPSQILFWACVVALILWLSPFVGIGLTWADYLDAPNHVAVTGAVLLGLGCIVTGVPSRLVIVARARAQRDAMAWLAVHDDLTGLFNRRHFYAALSAAVVAQRRSPFGVILLDVDGLKQTNDCHGHVAGDTLIRQAAARLDAAAGGHLVARTGGDEFAVLLLDTPEAEAREFAAAMCWEVAAAPIRIADTYAMYPSISAGVAGSDRLDVLTADALLRAADQDLYKEKRRRAAARAA